MAIELKVTTDGRVEITGYMSSQRYSVQGTITFMVDTGSQRTILGARDAQTLGFHPESFPAYTGRPLMGIGGKGKPFDVGPCQVVLGDAELVDVEQVLYFMPEYETRHRTVAGGLRRETRERSFAVPSLLGTDLLRRNKCKLEVDYAASKGWIRQ